MLVVIIELVKLIVQNFDVTTIGNRKIYSYFEANVENIHFA